MLYPFLTLEDNTEIVHSDAYISDGNEYVLVEIEKPVLGGFHSAKCVIPGYHWSDIKGFSEEDIERLQGVLESIAHIIIQLGRDGGFDNAAGF